MNCETPRLQNVLPTLFLPTTLFQNKKEQVSCLFSVWVFNIYGKKKAHEFMKRKKKERKKNYIIIIINL